MTQLPVEPPPAPAITDSREYLRRVATNHRIILLCLLGLVALYVIQLASPTLLGVLFLPAILVVDIICVIFVFRLAMDLFNKATGIVLGILIFVPVVSLIVLLILSQKAQGILRKHNIKVGFLGANPSKIQ